MPFGLFLWTVDVPTGASIAFNVSLTNATGTPSAADLESIAPGTSDNCLRQNAGQLDSLSMASLAAELSTASPAFVTGYTSVPHTSNSDGYTWS